MQRRESGYSSTYWSTYWFEKNVFGDVVAVYDNWGYKLVEYIYDAWGNIVISSYMSGLSEENFYNPVRYRGYYYDTDLRLYYLESRYYDSMTGRFINADDVSYLGANGDINSYNLYAYCSNNPIMYVDPSGHFVISISTLLIGIAIGAGVGAGISFGSMVYQDYCDDGEIFNGSVSVGEYIGNTVSGLITGAGLGACTVLGAGIGTAMIGGKAFVIGKTVVSGIKAFCYAMGTAFVTGGAGYFAKTIISSKETFQVSDMFIEAGANTFSGMLSFFGGMIGGITGIKVPRAKNGFKNLLKYHAGLTYFGVHPTKFFISQLKKQMQEMY